MGSGISPTESIAAVAGRVAHLWRSTTRARIPYPFPGAAVSDGTKIIHQGARDEWY